MTIASHLPVVSQAHATATLRALALVPGQTIEGRVLGPGLDGATLVQVGRQAMSLSLPNSQQVGATLTLSVQQAEGQLRLALIGSKPPASTPQPQQPATSVQISGRPAVAQAPVTYGPPTSVAAPAVSGAASAGTVGPAVAGLASTHVATQAGSALPGVSGLGAAPAVNPTLAVGPSAGPNIQRPGFSPYGMNGLNSASSPTPMTSPGLGAANAQAAALSQMVQQSLPSQASIGAVLGMMNAVAGQALPEPVMRAARQVLGNQLVARDGKVDAGALKAAISNSGVFQEAKLGQGAGTAAAGDTKSGLLAMRQGLAQWLGDGPPIMQVSQLPPPLKHVLPRARLAEVLQDEIAADSEEFGRALLERTEGALSRLRLHQHASLPDANKPGESQWSMDLPLAYAGQQTVVHLQIHHDGGTETTRPEDRGWQVRFAVNLPDLGEVGAQVSLRGQSAGILLWAHQNDTAKRFADAIDELRHSLEAAGLKAGALVVRSGAPGDQHSASGSGQFLDATR